MQLTLKEWFNAGDGLAIMIFEGTSLSAVFRSKEGNYLCNREQCQYKKNATYCEHVMFAINQYVDKIAVTAERKAEMERQKVVEEIERQKTKLKLLEQQLGVKEEPGEPALLDLDTKRRIVV